MLSIKSFIRIAKNQWQNIDPETGHKYAKQSPVYREVSEACMACKKKLGLDKDTFKLTTKKHPETGETMFVVE